MKSPEDPSVTRTPKLLAPDEGEFGMGVGGSVRWLVAACDTGGAMGAWVQTVAPGSGPPLHLHEDSDEALWIVDGEFECTLGSETRRLSSGGFLYIPRGTPHRFVNVSDREASVLGWMTPGGFEAYFRARVQIDPAREPERLREAAADFGMRVL